MKRCSIIKTRSATERLSASEKKKIVNAVLGSTLRNRESISSILKEEPTDNPFGIFQNLKRSFALTDRNINLIKGYTHHRSWNRFRRGLEVSNIAFEISVKLNVSRKEACNKLEEELSFYF